MGEAETLGWGTLSKFSEGLIGIIRTLPSPWIPARFLTRSEKMWPLYQLCQNHLRVCKKFKFTATRQTYQLRIFGGRSQELVVLDFFSEWFPALQKILTFMGQETKGYHIGPFIRSTLQLLNSTIIMRKQPKTIHKRMNAFVLK